MPNLNRVSAFTEPSLSGVKAPSQRSVSVQTPKTESTALQKHTTPTRSRSQGASLQQQQAAVLECINDASPQHMAQQFKKVPDIYRLGMKSFEQQLHQKQQGLRPVSKHAVMQLGQQDDTVARSAQTLRAKTQTSPFDKDILPGSEGRLTIVAHGDAQGNTLGGYSTSALAQHLKNSGITQLETLHLKSCYSQRFIAGLKTECEQLGLQIKNIEGHQGVVAIADKDGTNIESANGLSQLQHSGTLAKGDVDNNWYTDQDIWSVLQVRTADDPNSTVLAPLSNLELGNHLLKNSLIDAYFTLREQNPQAQQSILVPFNLDNNHWVGVRLDLDVRNSDSPIRVSYMDSLAAPHDAIAADADQLQGVPADLKAELEGFLGTVNRQSVRQPTNHYRQEDNHSCGPMTIENLLNPLIQADGPPDPLAIRGRHREQVPSLSTSDNPEALSTSAIQRQNVLKLIPPAVKSKQLNRETLQSLVQSMDNNDVGQAREIVDAIPDNTLKQKLSEVLFSSTAEEPAWNEKLGKAQVLGQQLKLMLRFGNINANRIKMSWSHPMAKLFDDIENAKKASPQGNIDLLRQTLAAQGLEIPDAGSIGPMLDSVARGEDTYFATQSLGNKVFRLKPCEVGETYHILAATALMQGTAARPKIYRHSNGPGDVGDHSAKQQRLAQEVFEDYRAVNPEWAIETNNGAGESFADSNINTEILAPFFLSHGPIRTTETIRAAFLKGADHDTVAGFIQDKGMSLTQQPSAETPVKRAAVWLSSKDKPKWINLTQHLGQIRAELETAGVDEIILMGDRPSAQDQVKIDKALKDMKSYNLTDFYKEAPFNDSMANQLSLMDQLYRQGGLVCNIGNKSGAMDGATLIGVPQVFMEAVSEEQGPFTRIGFSGVFSPFWNQICTDGDHLPEGRLLEEVLTCSETRKWHLSKSAD